MWATLKKIGEWVLIGVGGLIGTAFFGFIVGGFVILLIDSLFPGFPREAVMPLPHNIADWHSLVVIAIGCVAILGFFAIRSAVSRLLANFGKKLHEHAGWIVVLAITALCLIKAVAHEYVAYDKAFKKADTSASGRVVESDPGTPASGSGEDADPGDPPWSHYQFEVNGKTYDGWLEDDLPIGDSIAIRYNSSDPSFNHAEDDDRTLLDKEKYPLLLLFVVIAALVYLIRNRPPRGEQAT